MENCNLQPISIPDNIQIDTIDEDYLDKVGHLLYQQIINNLTYTI